MNEYIYRTDKDINGVNVFLLKGELVRCGDCRYYGNPFGLGAGADSERWCFLLGLVGAFDKDDYCSRGERKTAESE